MFHDGDDLILPEEGPPLPPLPDLEEEEHIAPGPSDAEPSIRVIVELLEPRLRSSVARSRASRKSSPATRL